MLTCRSAFYTGSASTALYQISVLVDPVSEAAQRWSPLLQVRLHWVFTMDGLENVFVVACITAHSPPGSPLESLKVKGSKQFHSSSSPYSEPLSDDVEAVLSVQPSVGCDF
jgi:hypothetical protein